MIKVNLNTISEQDYKTVLESLLTRKPLLFNGMECSIESASFYYPFDVLMTIIINDIEVKLELKK